MHHLRSTRVGQLAVSQYEAWKCHQDESVCLSSGHCDATGSEAATGRYLALNPGFSLQLPPGLRLS